MIFNHEVTYYEKEIPHKSNALEAVKLTSITGSPQLELIVSITNHDIDKYDNVSCGSEQVYIEFLTKENLVLNLKEIKELTRQIKRAKTVLNNIFQDKLQST